MPKTATPPVADQVRQFTACRCKDLRNLSARCLETLLREHPTLSVVIQDCQNGWKKHDRATALCHKTGNGHLRVRFVRDKDKVPLVIQGADYEEMTKALRAAALSHNIKVELN
jgi:hypothetical protein